MTHDEAVELLRMRWRMTSERFDDDTAELWAEALGPVDYQHARKALLAACREQKRVAFSDLYQAAKPKVYETEQQALPRRLDPEQRASPAVGRMLAHNACVAELVGRGLTLVNAEKRASELLGLWIPPKDGQPDTDSHRLSVVESRQPQEVADD